MKLTTVFIAAVATLSVVTAVDQPAVKTSAEALEKIEASALPDGVTLTGTTEMIDPPSTLTSGIKKKSDSGENKHDDNDDNKEHFGWGLGGWGNWGGWGVYGPYRFGFMCNGYRGWAYPLGYWNTFGVGLYGGGCGLGIPFGGLYYC